MESIIHRKEFHAFMDSLMDRFDLLDAKIDRMFRQQNTLNGDTLLDSQDLCLMLKVSKRTLQRYRLKGLLPHYMIEGKVYYKSSDINEFVKIHFNIPVRKPSKK